LCESAGMIGLPVTDIRLESTAASAASAALAERSLGNHALPEAYFRWLASHGLGRPALQYGAYDGDTKVGHVAVSPQAAFNKGRPVTVAHVIDLFIAPERRSVTTVQALYRRVVADLKRQAFDVVAAVPNVDATQIDRFFLKVKPLAPMAITMVPATPFGVKARAISRDPGQLAGFLAGPPPRNGVAWGPLELANRLSRPGMNYVLASNGDALCIASPRRFKGVPLALICGVFARPGAPQTAQQLRRLCADAAGLAGQWAAVYVGRNPLDGMPPGFAMPDALRPSPMVLHVGALTPQGEGFDPERFEAIDFDFA
jgi:hypothetical protein